MGGEDGTYTSFIEFLHENSRIKNDPVKFAEEVDEFEGRIKDDFLTVDFYVNFLLIMKDFSPVRSLTCKIAEGIKPEWGLVRIITVIIRIGEMRHCTDFFSTRF